jgi:hypothetical protein
LRIRARQQTYLEAVNPFAGKVPEMIPAAPLPDMATWIFKPRLSARFYAAVREINATTKNVLKEEH